MRTRARLLLGVAIALVALACALPLSADDYPTRPVRVIIGFGPGAVADLAARAVGARMSGLLGQQIVVENRPGAGSSIAAEYVARAPKDGYTLLMATVANTINAAISTLPFDFGKDLAPIALVANVPNVLVVHPSLGVSSVRELIALAKAKPEQLFYASAGAGTLGHLSGVLLNIRAGVKLVHVPYPGSPQGVTDLLAGRVNVMFSPASTVWPHVEAGQAQGAGDHGNQAGSDRARSPDHGGGRTAGIRHRHLDRPVGARGHIARGDRQARERAQRRAQGRRGAHRCCAPRASSRSAAARRNSPAISRPTPATGPSSPRRPD